MTRWFMRFFYASAMLAAVCWALLMFSCGHEAAQQHDKLVIRRAGNMLCACRGEACACSPSVR